MDILLNLREYLEGLSWTFVKSTFESFESFEYIPLTCGNHAEYPVPAEGLVVCK